MILPTTDTTNEIKCLILGHWCWCLPGPGCFVDVKPGRVILETMKLLCKIHSRTGPELISTYDLALPRDRTKLFASYSTDFHHPVLVPVLKDQMTGYLMNITSMYDIWLRRDPCHIRIRCWKDYCYFICKLATKFNKYCVFILILIDYQYSWKQLWFKIMIIM